MLWPKKLLKSSGHTELFKTAGSAEKSSICCSFFQSRDCSTAVEQIPQQEQVGGSDPVY